MLMAILEQHVCAIVARLRPRLEGCRREQLIEALVEARVLQAMPRDEREDAVQRQHACRPAISRVKLVYAWWCKRGNDANVPTVHLQDILSFMEQQSSINSLCGGARWQPRASCSHTLGNICVRCMDISADCHAQQGSLPMERAVEAAAVEGIRQEAGEQQRADEVGQHVCVQAHQHLRSTHSSTSAQGQPGTRRLQFATPARKGRMAMQADHVDRLVAILRVSLHCSYAVLVQLFC